VKLKIFLLLVANGFWLTAEVSPPVKEVKTMKIEEMDRAMAGVKAEDGLQWVDAAALGVEGKGFSNTESFYDRLPAKAKDLVEPAVWSLAQHSAGLCVRFSVSGTRSLSAKWKLKNSGLAMPHMPATGVSGLDLYIKRTGVWHWLGSTKPQKAPDLSEKLTSSIPMGETNELLLYLPLYNGVSSLAIGVETEGRVFSSAPRGKPVVFYGTSILQGGCASRPGLAFPAILGRRLDRPVINLGFSGNGKMQKEVVSLLAEIDASAFVIDCTANMSGLPDSEITARTAEAATLLRASHPDAPIVFVEGSPGAASFAFSQQPPQKASNLALKKGFDGLVSGGMKDLHYIEGALLLGTDGEGTVDGLHPNDLGMMRYADAVEPQLKKILR
jgi:lysophospholipase L1-like esterase